MSNWSEDEISISIDLLKVGISYDDIGKKINRTARSVRKKLSDLGFKYRDYQHLHYTENKVCKNNLCNKSFSALKSDNRLFCSRSCSASFNNKGEIKNPYGINGPNFIVKPFSIKEDVILNLKERKTKVSKCLSCEKTIKNGNKYCNSNCQGEHKRQSIFKEIENGNTTLNVNCYRRYLIYKYGSKCMECTWNEINPVTENTPIQLDHIDVIIKIIN